MRSTAASPASHPELYARLREDARLAEALGFHSVWLAEHHFWYDGWCPAALVAAASVLAVTSRLHVATGIHLLPLYDADRVAADLDWLQRMSGNRFEHGVGLGYRASEYDGFGVSRKLRGRRMDLALDRISQLGETQPRIWVGGMAEPALRRAASRGLGVILPSTLTVEQLRAVIGQVRAEADAAGSAVRVGVMKYAWVTDGSELERRRAAEALATWTREYAGSWFPLRGRPGFEAPDLLDNQVGRSVDTALIGSPTELSGRLRELEMLGADMCVLHLIGDAREPDHREVMAVIAEQVLPSVQARPA
jgi:alkanesulfonate monooxygenase SsuD/methylene tetrahydromethanopterin reductase-like flavin-dependent oxidoreductase (luciferase family)